MKRGRWAEYRVMNSEPKRRRKGEWRYAAREIRSNDVKGNPFTLVGPELRAGDKAPGFTVVGNDLKDVTLANTAGKVRLISVVPSLDTPVC
jgi:hypothetical protein